MFDDLPIYFSQKLYIVLKVTTAYFNNLIGILVHVGKSSNIVTHFDTVNYRLTANTYSSDTNDAEDENAPLSDLISKKAIFAVLCEDTQYDFYLVKANSY
jgi:hypothetical protein